MTPRRLVTPLMKAGAFAIQVGGSADDQRGRPMTVIKRFGILHQAILRVHPNNVTKPDEALGSAQLLRRGGQNRIVINTSESATFA